ncbi:hypothetical protein [Pseudomonas sp. UBA6323]|uniref:hypothetical protein n=1 Tax=Pseudomonas sp. UBA6323 TaxID=1947329 RepID=UPI0025CFD63A|nr:hypothetical protein [Pseudomonas sp. UBA6323]
MNLSRWKFLCICLGVVALVHFVMLHVALNQRDDARQATREQAIEQLCKGVVISTTAQPQAEPADATILSGEQRPAGVGQVRLQRLERLHL